MHMQKNPSLQSLKVSDKEFADRLNAYKKAINKCIDEKIAALKTQTSEAYGQIPLEVVSAYCDVLERGGKRIRGALAMAAYEMFGGTNTDMITEAATGLEIMNTYILLADDIQDRSHVRRGGKTAHIILKDYHKKNHLSGDPLHFGEAMAINALLLAQHYAMCIFSDLDADASRKIKAIENVNKCFMITAHGQSLDIFSEVIEDASLHDVNNVMEWKTAYYTFINPLQLGAILAGADDKELEGLADFGLHAGRTFQITDDIIGIFSDEAEMGKSPLDDIKEGKRTLLTVYAANNASKVDAYFLSEALGNQDLTAAEFAQCRQIISDCGALSFARGTAADSAKQALAVLKKHEKWDKNTKIFLQELVQYILDRKS